MGPWAAWVLGPHGSHRPMGPWAAWVHGPHGPHAPMGPMSSLAHGPQVPMDPWATWARVPMRPMGPWAQRARITYTYSRNRFRRNVSISSRNGADPLYQRLGRILIQRVLAYWRIRCISSGAVQYRDYKWHHYGFHNRGAGSEGARPSVVDNGSIYGHGTELPQNRYGESAT